MHDAASLGRSPHLHNHQYRYEHDDGATEPYKNEEEEGNASFKVAPTPNDTLESIVAQAMTESLDELMAFESKTALDTSLLLPKGKNLDLKARLSEKFEKLDALTDTACIEIVRERLLSTANVPCK